MFKSVAAAVFAAFLATGVFAQDADELARRVKALEQKLQDVSELQREIDVLTREIESLKNNQEKKAAVADVQQYGLGAAASKVYRAEPGVSFGGYGEFLYDKPQHGIASADVTRAVLYTGYKFNPSVVFNSELEVEHGTTEFEGDRSRGAEGGSVGIEFAYLDYLLRPSANIRAGLVLLPMGLINEQHEPTAFLGVRRPDVEELILPSTWRELGFGLYGEAGGISYRGYLVNGLNAAGYSADEGISEGRQEGSEALAKSWAFTGRADYVGMPGLTIGASVFAGDSGQGHVTPSGREIEGFTTVVDAHADWRWRGLWVRGLYAHTTIDEAGLINQLNGFEGDESIGSQQQGWYGQVAFDLLSLGGPTKMALWPFLRYEGWDTQLRVPTGYERNPENNVHQLTLGLNFYPINQLVVKADWQQRVNTARTGVNRFNVGLGYIF